MVNKAELVEKIAELVHEKRVDGISDIRDESDREGMRIVIELKRDVNANVVLNYLYKHTQMQDTFGAIMLALVDGEPQARSRCTRCIHHYLDHQKDVIVAPHAATTSTRPRRAPTYSEGLLIALDHIDEIVAPHPRASRTQQEAKNGLMERFGLSERQAQAILDMRLATLTGLEREKIEAGIRRAAKDRSPSYAPVLADEGMLLGIIRDELLEIKARFADERRTRDHRRSMARSTCSTSFRRRTWW